MKTSRRRTWLPVAVVLMLAFFVSAPVVAQQDPLDLGAADSAFFVISEPVVGAVDQVVTAELYFWHDLQDMGSVSAGFSWDNPNLVMESAVWSSGAVSAFNMMQLSYYQNALEATNANQLFQATGLRMMGDGLLSSTTAQLAVTYTFRASTWSANDQFCIDLAEFTPLAFVDTDNNEYVPMFEGPFCVGDAPTESLLVAPDSLFYHGDAGGAHPLAQSLSVTGSAGGSIDFVIEDDATWLLPATTAGTTPQDIVVGIDNNGLSAGTYGATIRLTPADSSSFTLVPVTLQLDPGNQPPVLNPIGNQSVAAGSLLEFTVTATDPDGDPISLYLDTSSAIAGVTFVDNGDGTGVFSWTPNLSQLGTHLIGFFATAGGQTDHVDIGILVTDPAGQDPNDLGGPDSLMFVISEPVVGAIDQVVTAELYFLHDVQNLSNVSSGFSWDNSNFVMESAVWSPEAAAAFNLANFTFYRNELDSTNAHQLFQATGLRIFGDGLVAQSTPQLAITFTFRVSTWSASDQFCINLDGFITLGFVDLDNIEYLPGFDLPVCVDGGGGGEEALVVTPPVLDFYCPVGGPSPPAQTIAITEAGGGNMAFYIDALANWIDLDGWMGITPFDISVTANPNGLGAGSYYDSILVTAADSSSSASPVWVTVGLHLTPVEDSPPILAPIPDQTVAVGSLLQFTVTATDADMDPISLYLDTSSAIGATFVDNGNGTGLFSWTPGSWAVGAHTIGFHAAAGGQTDYENLVITVTDPDPQDPDDQGLADSLVLEITEYPDATLAARLYAFNDVQSLGSMSSGFSWDNPNVHMDSMVWSPEAATAFDMMRFQYYRNSLDSTNIYRRFQSTGLRMLSTGIAPSMERKLIATYYFHVEEWTPGEHLCISYDNFVEMIFVDTEAPLNEYLPQWSGTECIDLNHDLPAVDFSANPLSGTAPLTVSFSDMSTGEVTVWEWNFGDFTYSNAQNPVHTYTSPGLYAVALTAGGAGGFSTEVKTDYILVSPGQQDPLDQGLPDSAFFVISEPTVGAVDQVVTAELYVWHDVQNLANLSAGFGWDNPNFVMESAVWSPEALAAFNLIRITYYENALDSTNATQLFQATGLRMSGGGLSASPAPQLVATYSFRASSWSAGDRFCIDRHSFVPLAFVDPVNHEYAPVWAGPGCVGGYQPVLNAAFSATPTTGTSPLMVSFTDGSTGDITDWHWQFGDGDSSTAVNPTHVYVVPGDYTVSLQVWDSGATDTETRIDYIHVEPSVGVLDTLAMEMETLSNNALAVELYAYNGNTDLANFSSGFSWDNPAFELDSAVWSDASRDAWDLFLGVYPMNLLDSANARQQIQATGLRMVGTGLPASPVRQLLVTYYFHSNQPGDTLCVGLDNWVNLVFVDPANTEYVPVWAGNECGVIDGGYDGCRTTMCLQGEVVSGAVDLMCVTLGMDTEAETREMPPEPPEYSCYLQIWGEQGAGPFGVEVRPLGADRHEWLLDVNPKGTVGLPFAQACATLSWDPGTLCPDGYYWLVDRGADLAGNAIVVADMRTVTEYEVCGLSQSHFYAIIWSDEVCLEQTFAVGWQMVSLPIVPEDASVETLFPGYLAAWEFEPGSGYVVATEFQPCRGYWLKLAAPVTVTVCGPPVMDCSNTLSSGWHMVGAPICIVGTPPLTNPPNLLLALWGYESSLGYVLPYYVNPWQGYWAKMGATGELLLDCMGPGIVTGGQNGLTAKSDGSHGFILSARTDDAEGLNRSDVVLGTDSEMQRYPSAPVPPEYSVYLELFASDGDGPFYRDVRLASEENASWLVSVRSSGVGSVHLTWDPDLLSDTYQLLSGYDVETGRVLVGDMRDVSQYDLTVSSETAYVTVVRRVGANGSAEALPGTYVLEQCYPNPFNPATEIKFGLPVAGDARLEIFNVLGQRVRILVDEPMAEGWYTFTWDGTDDYGQSLSTGVYLYRLTAEGYSSSKKMLLLK